MATTKQNLLIADNIGLFIFVVFSDYEIVDMGAIRHATGRTIVMGAMIRELARTAGSYNGCFTASSIQIDNANIHWIFCRDKGSCVNNR
jgi:hypothetical protein